MLSLCMTEATVKYLRFHTHMQDLTEIAKEKVAMIEQALKEGKKVWLGKTQVNEIKMVTSLTGRSAVVVVNKSKVLYLSNFIRYDVRIE